MLILIKMFFIDWEPVCIDLLTLCLQMEPCQRATASELLEHPFFGRDNFVEIFIPELKAKIKEEFQVEIFENIFVTLCCIVIQLLKYASGGAGGTKEDRRK